MSASESFESRSDNSNKLSTEPDEIERPPLHDRENCVYSTRVRVALENNGVEYDEIWVPEDNDNRDVVEGPTGQRTVPVVLDPAADKEYVTDTDRMLNYIEATYGGVD